MHPQQRPSQLPLLISVEEVANVLQIGRTAAWALVRKNQLKSVKIGRTRRVVVASLNDYINRLMEQEAL